MSYVNGLTYTQRRPSIAYLTPDEAIAELNAVADKVNSQIAKIEARARAMEEMARTYEAENKRLLARIAELEKQLGKQTPKAGKKKRPRRWLDSES